MTTRSRPVAANDCNMDRDFVVDSAVERAIRSAATGLGDRQRRCRHVTGDLIARSLYTNFNSKRFPL
jgi:hypothetical protein